MRWLFMNRYCWQPGWQHVMCRGMSRSRKQALQNQESGSTFLKTPPVSSWPSNASLMQDLLLGPSSVGKILEVLLVNPKLRLPPFPYFASEYIQMYNTLCHILNESILSKRFLQISSSLSTALRAPMPYSPAPQKEVNAFASIAD